MYEGTRTVIGNLYGAIIVFSVGIPVLFHTAEVGFDFWFLVKVIIIANLIFLPIGLIIFIIMETINKREVKNGSCRMETKREI